MNKPEYKSNTINTKLNVKEKKAQSAINLDSFN